MLCHSVAAQEAAPDSSEATPSAAPAAESIAIADIPARADVDTTFAQDVIERSRHPASVAALQPTLDALTQTVLKRRTQYKRDVLRKLPVIRLESLERQWNFVGNELDDWRSRLAQVNDPYLDDADRLGRRRAEWKATQAAADINGAPAALRERINSVQLQLQQAEQALSMPLDALLSLRQRAARVSAGIASGKDEVAAAIEYIDSRLTRRDAPPIWALQDTQSQTTPAGIETGLQFEMDFLKDYSQENRLLLRGYNFFELALLLLLLWFSVRVRKWPAEDTRTQASIRVLRRPFSTWLLIVMTGVLMVESDAPIFLHQFALFLMIVPLLRILPPRVYEMLGPWPYVISALYLLDLVSFALLENGMLRRLYLLGLTLLAIFLLTLFLVYRRHSVRNREQSATAPWTVRLLRLAGWLSIALMSAAAIANVLGNVSLAEMLTEALIVTAYIALVFYAGVHALTSLFYLILTKSSIAPYPFIARHNAALVRGFTRLLQLAAVCGWTVITLNQFRVYRPTYDATVTALTHTFEIGQISLTLGGVLLFSFSIVLAVWIAKTIRFVLRDEILPNMSLPRGVANSVSTLSYYFLIVGGLAVALVASGFEVSQLAFAIGALGVGIGLGLQDVVRNFVSGLILMFERPIQPGDVIEVGGTGGTVRAIGMRATTLATFEGAEVVVPNGVLLSEKLTNWTLSDMNRRFEITFGVAYGTDPKRVLQLALDTTKATPGIATTPEPVVLFSGMGASSLDFMVRAWTNNFADWVKTRSELTVRIHDAIVAAGIEIPFPQQDLHLRTIAPAAHASLGQLLGQPDKP